MKQDHYDWILVVFAGFLFGVLLGAIGANSKGRSDIRDEAVDAGVARWVCDPVTGKTDFQWVKQEGK